MFLVSFFCTCFKHGFQVLIQYPGFRFSSTGFRVLTRSFPNSKQSKSATSIIINRKLCKQTSSCSKNLLMNLQVFCENRFTIFFFVRKITKKQEQRLMNHNSSAAKTKQHKKGGFLGHQTMINLFSIFSTSPSFFKKPSFRCVILLS